MLTGPGRYLAADESVVLQARRHVAVLARPALAALGAIALALFVGLIVSPGDGGDLLDTLGGLFALWFLLRFLWRAWEWWVDRIFVTEKRIFEVSGLLTRKVASMPLGNLTDMTYQRSLWGRILGYGELIVETAGQAQALSRIAYLSHPDEFYRAVTALVTAGLLPSASAPEVTSDPPERGPDRDDTGPIPRVVV
ncbi:MAG TPA: PH domain-containing protein [Actinomycetota bacterium]|nr:PH domain-containing protein [Actinomycetota bacterium]